MNTVLFFEGLVIIGMLFILLRRKPVEVPTKIIVPGDGSPAISEAISKDIWNTTFEFEDRFKRNPIVKMHNNEGEPDNLRAAFEEATKIAFETAEGIREQGFYGAPAPLESYCASASRWYFNVSRNYAGWATALEQEEKEASKGVTGAVVKGAIKGAIQGYFGGWLGVVSMLQQETESTSDTPFDRHLAVLEAERERLLYERTYLNSERLSVQSLLVAIFQWEIESDAGSQ